MNLDSGIKLPELQVSGGMTSNKLLMQMQADILGVPVSKSFCSTKNSIKIISINSKLSQTMLKQLHLALH